MRKPFLVSQWNVKKKNKVNIVISLDCSRFASTPDARDARVPGLQQNILRDVRTGRAPWPSWLRATYCKISKHQIYGKFAETDEMQLAHLGTSPSRNKLPTSGAELIFKNRPFVFYVYDGRFGISYFNFGIMAGFMWVNDSAVYGAIASVDIKNLLENYRVITIQCAYSIRSLVYLLLFLMGAAKNAISRVI